MSTALLAGADMLLAAQEGFMAAIVAVGGWEMFLKHVLKGTLADKKE